MGYFKDNADVREILFSGFKSRICADAKGATNARYELHTCSDEPDTSIFTECNAREFIEFVDVVNAEIESNDIAIVIRESFNKYSNEYESCVYIVCKD